MSREVVFNHHRSLENPVGCCRLIAPNYYLHSSMISLCCIFFCSLSLPTKVSSLSWAIPLHPVISAHMRCDGLNNAQKQDMKERNLKKVSTLIIHYTVQQYEPFQRGHSSFGLASKIFSPIV